MKKNFYILALLVSVIASAFFGKVHAVAGEDETPNKAQLIKFSHAKHILAKSECTQCHDAVKSLDAADRILPRHEECQSCHEKEMIEDCNYCHFEDNLAPLPNPERKVNFSHKLHLAGKASTCETCHQGLEKTDFASEANLPSQSTCNTCHTDGKVKN